MAGDSMPAGRDTITHVTLCSSEIPSSKESSSVLFFVVVSDIEFKSKTSKVATKNL